MVSLCLFVSLSYRLSHTWLAVGSCHGVSYVRDSADPCVLCTRSLSEPCAGKSMGETVQFRAYRLVLFSLCLETWQCWAVDQS